MVMTSARRLLTAGAAAAVFVALGTGPASAHFCFKPALNERAAQGMSKSSNWVTFAAIAAHELPDLCPAGVAYVAAAAGATPNTLINGHGTMAGGTLRKGADAGNKAIAHLDFEALFTAVPGGYALCA